MPQTAKYFAKIFCMRNISQNTVRLFKQLTTFFKSIFLKYQSGFWKDPRNTVYSRYDWKVESISRNARFMWSLINKFVKSICLTATLPFDSKTSLFWIWENLYIKSKKYLSHREKKLNINKTFRNWKKLRMEYKKAPYWIHSCFISFLRISFCLYQIST